jgi:DNA polymerase I-like protein with 3'-5' exonuclease and polymerase domains
MRVATLDIETNGLLPEVDTIWCAHLGDMDTRELTGYRPHEIEELLAALDEVDVLIGHNIIAYDLEVLRRLKGYEFKGKVCDTLLMSRTQRPNRFSVKGSKAGPHSVEAWGYRLGLEKVEHEDWTQFSEHMFHRNRRDVEVQMRIYDALLEEGKGEGWMPAHRLNNKLFTYLRMQETRGWHVDQEHLDRCIHQLEHWTDRIVRATVSHLPLIVEVEEAKKDGRVGWVKKPFLKSGKPAAISERTFGDMADELVGGVFTRVSFRRVDLDKNGEVKEFLLSEGWQPAEWNLDDDGNRRSPKLSQDDPFIGVQGSLGKLIAKRVQCKQRLGVMRGWREAVVDGRIHGSVTGLASTARMRHKTIVNVPGVEKGTFYAKQMRAVFTASPGMVMVGVDSKGNQVRQLAARMGDEEFTHAVLHGNKEDGTDLHSVNQRKSGVPTRGHAKNFFYGFLFGASDHKIGQLVGGSKDAGRRLKEQYLAGLPKLKRLIDTLVEEWRSSAQIYYDKKLGRQVFRNGYITGVDGRPILVSSEHAVLCYCLQSDEAIHMSHAYVLIFEEMERRGFEFGVDWAMLTFYHDEFQMEALPHVAPDVKEVALWAIDKAGRDLGIPIDHAGDAGYGLNWKETH